MKLTAEQRKLLETVPLDVLMNHAKRRRAIEKAHARVARCAASIVDWKAKLADAEHDLALLLKLEK